MKNKIKLLVAEFIIGAVGIYFLFAGDWQVAVGVMLYMWSSNIQARRKLYENS